MTEYKTIGDIIVYKDNNKEYFYTRKDDGTFILLGKKLLKGLDRGSNVYIELKQLILTNSLKSADTQAKKKS